MIPINELYDKILSSMGSFFRDTPKGLAEENLQARIRGNILMAVSNKIGALVLNTGNKTELALGYCTMYGDMCGALGVISDINKLEVYELSKWINKTNSRVIIPENVINKKPSAELKADQKDTDSLPSYDLLDPILEAFIERDYSVDQITELGYERKTVGRILGLVKRNEYKRRQAPPGVRVSGRAFGRDWRYPITSGY